MQTGPRVLCEKSSIFQLWCALIGLVKCNLYIEHGDKHDDDYSMVYLDLLGIFQLDIIKETNHK